MTRFPKAPADSWISDEGWLIIGDEAWTEHEWRIHKRLPGPRPPHKRYDSEQQRSEARRRTNREYMRRYRAGKAA